MCWLSRLVVPNKQQKSRLKQTIYTAKAPSFIARLLRSSYRHTSEQGSVEPYHFVPSRVLYLLRQDCMSFTSIWFEADSSLFMPFHFMTGDGVPSVWSWIDRVGPLSTVCYVICSRGYRCGLNLWLVVLVALAFIKELMCWLSRLVVSNK